MFRMFGFRMFSFRMVDHSKFEHSEFEPPVYAFMFQERFFNMTRAYYKGAVGALIVFDWSNVKTFDAVDKWKRDLVSTVGF